MTYPLSSDVSAGQPTAAVPLQQLAQRCPLLWQPGCQQRSRWCVLCPLRRQPQHRLPGHRQAAGELTHPTIRRSSSLAAACWLLQPMWILQPVRFQGAAATYYIHAIRTAGSTTFTLSVNTTPTDSDTSRPIGTCYWDGSAISSITSWYGSAAGLPAPGYDSGWFACAYNVTYTKVHGLGGVPKSYLLLHSATADGASENVSVLMGATSGGGSKGTHRF